MIIVIIIALRSGLEYCMVAFFGYFSFTWVIDVITDRASQLRECRKDELFICGEAKPNRGAEEASKDRGRA